MSDWIAPTPAEVSAVVGYLVEDNLRRQFFAELQNPTWVAPLDQLEVFNNVPQMEVDAEGERRARPWPEGEYLARMATAEPDLVARILARQPDSENPWVNSALLDAALALPPAHAAPLAKKVATAVGRGWLWVDADAVVRLAERLVSSHSGTARELLSALFAPRVGPEEVTALGTTTRVAGAIDNYWYGELAPRAVPLLASLGMKGLELAAGWLLKALEIGGDRDGSAYIWRPSIAPHEQNVDIDEVNALIDTVRDVAVTVGAGSLQQVVDFLEARGRGLLRRIAVEAAAQVVERGVEGDALDVATRLLLDESLLDIEARPEYVHLARTLLPRLPEDGVLAWQAMIRGEQWQGPDDLMRRLARGWDADPGAVTEEEVSRVRRRLTYRLLLPLGEILPAAERARLAELKAEFGELEHPEFASYTSTFTGPTSPVDHTALGEMPPEELFAFLHDWQPADGHGFGPSIEGLARNLEVVAERQPDLLAAIAPRLLDLRRSYVRAAVSGWAKAVAAGFDPPPAVWELIVRLVGIPDTGDDVDGDFEADDPVWRWAQRRALDLVTAYVHARGEHLDTHDARRAWAVVAPLTSHRDPTPQHEERYGGDNMDPLTLSLNTTRPAALRAAVEVLRRLPTADPEATTLRGEILDVLARHVSSADDPSLAVAAVFGEALGRLASLDRSWVDARADALFDVLSSDPPSRARADVVVSVALRVYHTGPAVFDLLRGVMLAMFSPRYAATKHVEGWRGRRSTVVVAATHVLRGYLLGFIGEDDLLLARLSSADAPQGIFAEALGHIGWEIMHAVRSDESADGVAPDVLDRAKRLIDRRVEAIKAGHAPASELSGFYWWVRAEAYDPSWSLPILRLAASDPGFDPKGLLGEALATAAERAPGPALDVFDALRQRGDGWERYDMLRHAPSILAAALRSPDKTTQHRARRILDELGRAGHLSILRDVDRLTGDVT